VGTNHISETVTVEATVVKFCTQVGYVKSLHTDNKSPLLKRGVVRVTWAIFNFWAQMISLKLLKLDSSNFTHR